MIEGAAREPGLSLETFPQARKGGGIVDGDIGQHFAVDGDAAALQAVHQHGISGAVETGGSVDAGNPQAVEIALAYFAAFLGITQAAAHLFARDAVLLGLSAIVALGELKHLATFL